jgi:hypothetical protein
MNLSFVDWVSNGWLVAHNSSKQEIGNLLGIVARDLKDRRVRCLSQKEKREQFRHRRRNFPS